MRKRRESEPCRTERRNRPGRPTGLRFYMKEFLELNIRNTYVIMAAYQKSC